MFRKASSLFFLLCVSLFAAQSTRIAIVCGENEANSPSEVRRAAAQTGSGLMVDVITPAEQLAASGYDVIFVDERTDLGATLEAQVQAASKAAKLVVVSPKHLTGNIAAKDAELYWQNASQDNYTRLFTYLASQTASHQSLTVAPPIVYPEQSFYHPDAGTFFPDFESYRRWYTARPAAQHRYDSALSTIGISFNRNFYTQKNLVHIEALVRSIERHGANAVAFMSKGAPQFDPYLVRDGKPLADVLLYHGERLNFTDYQAGLAQARKLDIPLLAVYLHYRMNVEQYKASDTGLAPGMTANLVDAERDGVFEPLVIGARAAVHDGGAKIDLIDRQVDWRVERALAWAKLRRVKNSEKKVVFTFWSEGGGKANVGGDPDDFLDVPGSLSVLLKQMSNEDYNVGPTAKLPSSETLVRRMSLEASNVGNWARAELARRVKNGVVALVPESTYCDWFKSLPAKVQHDVTEQWGPPPGKVMVYEDERGGRFLVIPKLQWGNILIAPHPDWGYLQDKKALLSTGALPPHHQYLAFFLWLQKEWHADAWVSLFSNITLQEGKAEGPAMDDPVGILLGAIPHIHPEKLGTNGGMSNKRKALALTPGWFNALVPSEATRSLSELRARLARYAAQSDSGLRQDAEAGIREEAMHRGLDRVLSADVRTMPFDELASGAAKYIAEVEKEQMPKGSHILGSIPDDATVAAMGAEMLNGVAASSGQSLAADYAARLRSGPREVKAILEALNGHRIEPGPMDEPLRDPDSLPAGRALYNFNQRLVPTPEAEATAARQADALIADYRAKHNGEFPRKLGLVLWSAEIAKSHGAMEAEALYLLGVRVVRNHQGDVVDVALIPRDELGRPRVDVLVTTSGVYRDHYSDKIELIAKAAQLAATSGESDNPVSQNTQANLAAMVKNGESAQRANQLANARVFAPAPNAYSPSIQFLAKSGNQRGTDALMADLYTSRLGHAYGGGLAGEAARPAFEQNLKKLQAATLSRSDHINGVLDDPMPAGFLGGMNMAARAVNGGKNADLYINDLRDAKNPHVETLERTLHRELDTRYFNPAWIEGMKTHGYDGARYMMDLTDNLSLWDTTSPGSVQSEDWQQVKSVYVDDSKDLQLGQFFAKNNPFAKQVMLANLMQVAARGDWKASASDLADVAKQLAQSAAANGIVCEANVCRNDKLTRLVENALQHAPDGARLLSGYHEALDRARLLPDKNFGAAPAKAPSVSVKAATPARARRTANPPVTGRALETVTTAGRPVLWSKISLVTAIALALFGGALFGLGWVRKAKGV